MVTNEQVLTALSNVIDPDLGADLVSLKMIEDLRVEGNIVSFSIVLTTPACPLKDYLERESRRAVVMMTEAQEVKIKVISRVPENRRADIEANQFKYVIAVGSGKGGVGKSTIAVNLAYALAMEGARVGLLDADIYGPNIPRMLGIDRLPPTPEGHKILPAEVNGIKVVSIGFMVQEGQPLIWRGPILHSAIQQFLTEFDWGMLDYLVVDLPPGTGDVQLSLNQTLPITGAVVVTTPQQVAVDDAYRAAAMFQKLDVPVLGIIENMAYLSLPGGQKVFVFGEAGGENLAFRLGVPFLGRVPLDPAIGQAGDIGTPFVEAEQSNESAQALRQIARNIAAETSKVNHQRQNSG